MSDDKGLTQYEDKRPYDEYRGKDLLAYAEYCPRQSRKNFKDCDCISFPQYCFDGKGWKEIPENKDVFPERGRLPMRMVYGDADACSKRYGKVVVMCVLEGDERYGRIREIKSSEDLYSGRIDFRDTQLTDKQQIQFTKLSGHERSKTLMQIVDLIDPIDIDKPTDQPVQIKQPGPLTEYVLVARGEGDEKVYYGPYSPEECQNSGNDQYNLKVSGDFIIPIKSSKLNPMELLDNNEESYATFVDAQEVDREVKREREAKREKTLQEIRRRLGVAAGRKFERNDVANLMICVTQGYITTLAGLPGTGKTSMANALGVALGLKRSEPKSSESSHFVQVAVERGWVSYRDFVGYNNSLTGTTVKPCPELYDLLERAAEEQQCDEVAPWLILLDEANLSPLEHYWSPFLGKCDSFLDEPMSLSLGDEKSLQVPTTMRFIATVNFDYTTEELSPRFLDRTWVISLDDKADDKKSSEGKELINKLIESDAGSAKKSASFDPIFAKELNEAFGARDLNAVKDEYKSQLGEVIKIFSEHQCPISPRSLKMMLRYISAAQELFDETDEPANPVDFAISQKVLPGLSGSIEKLGGLVAELAEYAGNNGLPKTKAHLEHMKNNGDISGFIQFFA